jgi:hypothetical protein
VLEPTGLPPELRESFRSAIEAAGAEDLRINEDDEGRWTVSFRFEAADVRDALIKGSDMTLSALKRYSAVRWVASGVTHWPEDVRGES